MVTPSLWVNQVDTVIELETRDRRALQGGHLVVFLISCPTPISCCGMQPLRRRWSKVGEGREVRDTNSGSKIAIGFIIHARKIFVCICVLSLSMQTFFCSCWPSFLFRDQLGLLFLKNHHHHCHLCLNPNHIGPATWILLFLSALFYAIFLLHRSEIIYFLKSLSQVILGLPHLLFGSIYLHIS